MTRSGPQLYPGADQTHRYQSTYPGDAMEVNVVVLHTTEGRTLPDYDGGAVAPNLTAVPDFTAQRLRWYQHFDIDTSSRALVNLAGGVETNTLNVCQIELVGTCDPATSLRWGNTSHIFWPAAPDWALEGVAEFLAWMHDQHGVPLSGPDLWLPYPESYGASRARMSFAEWEGFKGVCGHQHAAENLHGDPGSINFAALIGYAKEYAGDDPTTGPVTPAKPTVSLAHVVTAARKDPGAAQGHATYKAEVLLVEKALKAEGLLSTKYVDGSFGTKTITAYARWQRSPAGGGYVGTAADGIPGKASLKRLGARHGFTVTT